MNLQEFSNEFDIYYNNISSNAAPGLNEYEKSVILTRAQIEVMNNHFNAKGNKYQEGFDDSIKRQIDFSNMIKVCKPTENDGLLNPVVKMDNRSYLFEIPDDVMFIINETANVVYDGKYRHKINIIPIQFTEYLMLISKPFKQPYKHQGWRLINATNDKVAEVIIKEGAELNDYTMRYVRYPKPIILIDLDQQMDDGNYYDLSIQGCTKKSECELDPSLHLEILQRAVEIAKNTYSGDLATNVQLGSRVE